VLIYLDDELLSSCQTSDIERRDRLFYIRDANFVDNDASVVFGCVIECTDKLLINIQNLIE